MSFKLTHSCLFSFIILILQFLHFTFSISSLNFPCNPPNFNSYPFCNKSLSIPERAQSLISLLTLKEKIHQLSDNASGIPRLGIPAYEWWSESLHGIATNGPGISFNGTISSATSFPQVIVSASSFNRTLWFKIGSAVAIEARAMYNVGQAGLTYWAPNINIFRDPRWGRGQETPGEDPVLTSAYSVEYVRGFQGGDWGGKGSSGLRGSRYGERRILKGNDDESLMLSACCKHFTAYDLEKWRNFSRYSFNAVVTEQDMEDTYQPPFRSCIQQGKASCLMCSYNAVNGVPACMRDDLFQKARDEWGFKGYITSDCDAVATVFEYQNYTKTGDDAVADVLNAGVDIDCGTYMLRHAASAMKKGKVKEEQIDRALLNLFSVQLRLGLFDGDPRKGKFGKLGPQDVCSTQHKELALEAAKQGIVLLKNRNNLLPLKKDTVSSLAIIGPMANSSKLGGDYTGFPCEPKSIYEEFKQHIIKTTYAAGCADVPCASNDVFDNAVDAAKQADFVIVIAGIDLSQETEDNDRISLLLPGKQMELVSRVAAASKKPVILALTGGGSLDVSFAEDDPRIASILWIGYPGEAGGRALAEIVFGEYNPGGRLTMTWYPETFTNVVPMTDMNMRPDPSRGYPGRTYRFYTGKQVYSFGQGLSYTNFTYKILSAPSSLSLLHSLPPTSSQDDILLQRGGETTTGYLNVNEMTSCDSLRFNARISVTNVGDMDGSHVVMLFVRAPKGGLSGGGMGKKLIGFDRVHVVGNGSSETSVLVDPCRDLSVVNEFGKRIVHFGDHVFMIGDVEHFVSVKI